MFSGEFRPLREFRCRRSRASHRLVMATIVMGGLIPTMGPGCPSETEPNDVFNEADEIRFGSFSGGKIEPIADIDLWRRAEVQTGDLVYAYVDSSNSGASKDSFLTVVADDTATVIGSDDSSGPEGGSVVAGAEIQQSGDVYFRVNEDGDNMEISNYLFYQAILDPSDVGQESELNSTPVVANLVTNPLMEGTVNGADVDYFRFYARTASVIVAIIDEDPDGDGDLTDTYVDLLDTDGVTVLATGDNINANPDNAIGGYGPLMDGVYYLRIRNGGFGVDSNYRFTLLVTGMPYADADGDMVPDSDDNCPSVANADQADTDADGFGDVCDACPMSELKAEDPGDCGCDAPDIDIDGDGVIDCGLEDPARALLPRAGLLLATNVTKHTVVAFDPTDGTLVDPEFVPADPAHMAIPVDVTLGPDQQTVLVSDADTNAVHQFDLDGRYMGIFAPTGGVNVSILEGPTGMAWRPNGHLLVGVSTGPNADAIAEFDRDGNYLGNFVDSGVGGLFKPIDLLVHSNGRLYVTMQSDTILEYDENGVPIQDYAKGSVSRKFQLMERPNGNVQVAASDDGVVGLITFVVDGEAVQRDAPMELAAFFGMAMLDDGHQLVNATPTTVSGIEASNTYLVDADGRLVRLVYPGAGMLLINRVVQDLDADADGTPDVLDGCPDDPEKTAPGQCGCGQVDVDSDGDGVADCVDQCPDDPMNDSDGDGVCDSGDLCPGQDDLLDANADGAPDCLAGPDPAEVPTGGECCGGGMPMLMPFMLLGWSRMRRRTRRRS